MKAERPYPQVHITPKGQRALQAGHPWVYAGEVTELTGPVEDGGLTDIIGSKGAYLGTGFYNSHSLIRCRLLSLCLRSRFGLHPHSLRAEGEDRRRGEDSGDYRVDRAEDSRGGETGQPLRG